MRPDLFKDTSAIISPGGAPKIPCSPFPQCDPIKIVSLSLFSFSALYTRIYIHTYSYPRDPFHRRQEYSPGYRRGLPPNNAMAPKAAPEPARCARINVDKALVVYTTGGFFTGIRGRERESFSIHFSRSTILMRSRRAEKLSHTVNRYNALSSSHLYILMRVLYIYRERVASRCVTRDMRRMKG